MKLVSIIIPYFKKKQHIHKSVNSVLRQSYKNFELIIVYDDEKKEDLKYLEKIQKLDKRIKLIINKKNFGAGISRNIGIKYSKGAFIAFLDADDIWHQSKLKIQLEYMLKNNLNITHTSYKILSEGKFIDNRTARTIDDFNELLKSCDIGLSTVMLRKKIYVGEKQCLSRIHNRSCQHKIIHFTRQKQRHICVGSTNSIFILDRMNK